MRLLKWLAIGVAVLAAIVGLTAIVVDTQVGHRFVADRVNALKPASGLRFRVGRIDGSLYGTAELVDFRLYDPQGLVLAVPRARLKWHPFAWLSNRLDVDALDIPVATFAKLPKTIATSKKGPILPDFDIRIGRLRVERLIVAPRVTGVVRYGRVEGRADIRDGRALIDLAARVEGSDELRLHLDSLPEAGRFDLAARARGSAAGVLARLSGLKRTLALDVGGKGDWRAWNGAATLDAGAVRVADLRLGNAAGRYTLSGVLRLESVTHGKLKSMTAPVTRVSAGGTFERRVLDGTVQARSPAIVVNADGAVDLTQSVLRNVRVTARLTRSEALLDKLHARAMELRAILDGPLGGFGFDYRITAPQFTFDKTGFDNARAAGRGRWSKQPVVLPVAFTASRVTGVGDVAGGILRNLSVVGVLRVTSTLVTGDDLRLRSDKLTGRINLMLSLANGQFDVGVNGALGQYLIPGLGVVDVQSRLRVVPGPGGHGTRVIGHGTAQMRRLDNGFFRSLAGGLPHIETGLERTTDGVLHFTGLVLTAPSIRLAGNGYRRTDGTFHFEGAGRQATYGALTLKLDGQIDKPTLDLVFQRPNDTLGLQGVVAHLDPTPAGFAWRARGQSRLGPFDGEGAILLPKGANARIQVARLDVSGTRASGAMDIVDGGFAGRLAVNGGGLLGNIDLAPQGDLQRISGRIDASGATLGRTTSVRTGRVEFSTLLDPAGARTEATFSGTGLRRGGLYIGRFAANARLTGSTGELRASIAGSRGGGFQIATVTQIAADRYTIAADGRIGRRAIRLDQPAVVRREGDGWVLERAQVAFAGGTMAVGGRFGGAQTALSLELGGMPLSVLDIASNGLGLGGTAFGTVTYASAPGAAPTGRVDLTVRGLSRSGLLQSSAPIDLGVAGVLTADKLGVRMVMASGGKTVGRAQALLRPLGAGGLVERLTRAGVFAQLRYDGPADTLWRLTRVELFDLGGPVSIAADVSGTVLHPDIRGTVRARGASVTSATTGTALTNVEADGQFAGSRLNITRFAADAGNKGGRVTGSGRFDLAGANGVAIDLNLAADHALMIDRDDIGATITGPLRFQSGGDGGTISGDVRLDTSRYRLGQATAASAVPQIKTKEINLPPGSDDVEEASAPWTLDVHARARNGLMVSGLGLSSEWTADVQLKGTPTNPAITGRADLVRGDYEFAGREFELDRGIIRFAGEVPANPALDIEANADANGVNASIRVTGVAQKPEITFTSVPALPQDELLSRLLFGTSITNLSAPEALQLAAAVAALQDGGNGLNPINAVRRAAGLDRLRILPADPQTGQQTSVAAGKYITRRIYAEIITDGQGYSATRVEFQVTRWLSLLSSISTLGRQSANVRVSKDY